MTETTTQLLSELGELSPKERAEIAYELIRSLDEGEDEGAEGEWEADVTRRVEEIQSGKVKGKPARQLFDELREERS